jgi:hypothetical protein
MRAGLETRRLNQVVTNSSYCFAINDADSVQLVYLDEGPHYISNLKQRRRHLKACVCCILHDTSHYNVISDQSRQSSTCTFSVRLH